MDEQKRENINELFSVQPVQNDDIQKKMYDISDVLNNNFGNRMTKDGIEVIESLRSSSADMSVAAPLIGDNVDASAKARKKREKKERKQKARQEKIRTADTIANKAKEKSAADLKVTSDAKFRARALIITILLCGGIAAGGVYYINYLRTPGKGGTTVSNAAPVTEAAEQTTAEITTYGSTSAYVKPSGSVTTAASRENITHAETTVTTDNFSASVGELTVTAYADKSGCHIEWKDRGNNYLDCNLDIEISDGRTDSYSFTKSVAVPAGSCTITDEGAQDAVSGRITIKRNGETVETQTFMVENRTYKPQNTKPVDIDTNGLI